MKKSKISSLIINFFETTMAHTEHPRREPRGEWEKSELKEFRGGILSCQKHVQCPQLTMQCASNSYLITPPLREFIMISHFFLFLSYIYRFTVCLSRARDDEKYKKLNRGENSKRFSGKKLATMLRGGRVGARGGITACVGDDDAPPPSTSGFP